MREMRRWTRCGNHRSVKLVVLYRDAGGGIILAEHPKGLPNASHGRNQTFMTQRLEQEDCKVKAGNSFC